jgi:hypothetical protein
MKTIFNPFTEELQYISADNLYIQESNSFQTLTGSGVGAFVISDIPLNSSLFLEYILKGKLDGADEFYIEQVTKRLYRGSVGNIQQLSGSTTSLSENFTINPNRAQTLGADSYTLLVSSGGVQTINWDVYVSYILTEFPS